MKIETVYIEISDKGILEFYKEKEFLFGISGDRVIVHKIKELLSEVKYEDKAVTSNIIQDTSIEKKGSRRMVEGPSDPEINEFYNYLLDKGYAASTAMNYAYVIFRYKQNRLNESDKKRKLKSALRLWNKFQDYKKTLDGYKEMKKRRLEEIKVMSEIIR